MGNEGGNNGIALPQSDHDILIELRGEMRHVREDVKEIRDTIKACPIYQQKVDAHLEMHGKQKDEESKARAAQATKDTAKIGLFATIISLGLGKLIDWIFSLFRK